MMKQVFGIVNVIIDAAEQQAKDARPKQAHHLIPEKIYQYNYDGDTTQQCGDINNTVMPACQQQRHYQHGTGTADAYQYPVFSL